jgi:3'(2'), 5'-bisphosphate nucleotidase
MTVSISLDEIGRTVALAHMAGQAIMEIYGGDFTVETKDDLSPITAADRAAERIIEAGLSALTPGILIVGEEAFATGQAPTIQKDRPFWLVDPLDGTKEFVKRNGEFTVNIALIDAGRPVMGVVHAPAIGETYWASRAGAFAETRTAPTHAIKARRPPREGLVALVSRSHPSPETQRYLATLNIKREMEAGSSLKFCLVAAGRADIYPRFGRTMEWDTAAGHAVLRFAGGSVTDVNGDELLYGKPGLENPPFIASGANADQPK